MGAGYLVDVGMVKTSNVKIVYVVSGLEKIGVGFVDEN